MRTFMHLVTIVSLLISIPTASAATREERIQHVIDSNVRAWLQDPVVIDALKAQNNKHTNLTQEKIEQLDQQWRAERKANDHPLIDSVLANPLSEYLLNIKGDSEGLFTEIFIMDDKGLNAGQADVTSDYWQGDEDKWQKTYLAGPDEVFIDEVEYDDSSQKFQVQVSTSVVDPNTNAPISAVTIGISLMHLLTVNLQ